MALHQLLLRRLHRERGLLVVVAEDLLVGLLRVLSGYLLGKDLVRHLPRQPWIKDHGFGRQVAALDHASRVVVVVHRAEVGLLAQHVARVFRWSPDAVLGHGGRYGTVGPAAIPNSLIVHRGERKL